MKPAVLVIAGYAESIIEFRGQLIMGLVAAGMRVHVAAPGLEPSTVAGSNLERMGVSIHDIPLVRGGTNPLVDLRLFLALLKLMRVVCPHTMLAYTIKPIVYGSIAGWLARVQRRIALVTGLGYAFTSVPRGVAPTLARLLYGFALRRVHCVIFQNPDDRALFQSTGVLPGSVESAVVNGSGVDLQHYLAVPPPSEASFLMISRLLGNKGVREYVEACRQVRKRFPAVRCRLAGWIDPGPDAIGSDELEGWLESGAVEFLGRLEDVRPAIAEASVYVLPSYREGTPRSVLEAMAMARPVITTDAPGCRQTVEEGENGFLVPVASVEALVAAMCRFIENPGLATRMGKASRCIAEERYDVHKVNAAMLKAIGGGTAFRSRTRG